MEGKRVQQIDFTSGEQEIRFILWENQLEVATNCPYGGNTEIILSGEDIDELLEMLKEHKEEE